MEGQTFVSRFLYKNRKFYVQTEWGQHRYSVTVTDGSKVWFKEITADYIEEKLKPAGMPLPEYMDLAKKALTSQDLRGKQFAYAFIEKLGQDGLKIEADTSMHSTSLSMDIASSLLAESGLGYFRNSLPLELDTKTAALRLGSMFDWLIDTSTKLEAEALQLTQDNRKLKQERDATTDRFEAMATDKIHLEEHLYKQFVVVLNAKKEKLRQMRDEVRQGLENPKIESVGGVNVKAAQAGADAEPPEAPNSTGPEHSESPDRSQPSPSLTFNVNYGTPSVDLLAADMTGEVQAKVRKRWKPDGQTDPPHAKKQFSPFQGTPKPLPQSIQKSPLPASAKGLTTYQSSQLGSPGKLPAPPKLPPFRPPASPQVRRSPQISVSPAGAATQRESSHEVSEALRDWE